MFFRRFLLFAFFFVMICCLSRVDAKPTRVDAKPVQNVLFIAVDDLRPELACYGSSHIQSPNIDRLAKSGRLFKRAYCQQAVCNPSRTSVMTGMRPDTLGVTGNHVHFRTNHPDVITLPQHFKEHGYHAEAIGKIFHGVFPDGSSNTKWDTMGDPQSWSTPATRFGPRYYYTEKGIAVAKEAFKRSYRSSELATDDWTRKLVFGLATEAPEVPDTVPYDGQVAESAVEALRRMKDARKPFFLAVGFIKPHSPYIAPKKYFDLYPRVAGPDHTDYPELAPDFAGHSSGEIRRYVDQPNTGSFPETNQRQLRRAYFACVSYIDAQIGRVLDELERLGLDQNTMVILWGDHGYHLGEQGLWGKTTNFELDTRVPLIIRTPEMKAPGRSTSSLVELVDLYPTISELAGLPANPKLEGTSLVPIIDDPDAVTKEHAFSQFPRAGGLMGYSVRNATHRLTRWVHRASQSIRETELYHYDRDLIETKNIRDQSPELVNQLANQLNSTFHLEASSQPSTQTTSFEQVPVGAFQKLDTDIGLWMAESGRSLIDDRHAATGKNCLQLTGGSQTSVTLQFRKPADDGSMLVFEAERWTARKPFSFRIEKESEDGWQEIFNGDQTVRVGRAFLNHVKVSLGENPTNRLRFTVTSPPETGVLIDDIRILPALPQKVVGVEVIPMTVPALVGTEFSSLLKLRIRTEGFLNPIRLQSVLGSITDTTSPSDLDSFHFRYGDAAVTTNLSDDASFAFAFEDDTTTLEDGENVALIGCRLSQDADIDHTVGVSVHEVVFSNGQSIKLETGSSSQRLGIAVRQAGEDGVHTYRIPGLVTTNQGSLIGVYDVRRRGGGDLPNDIDVGMSRSTDGGRVWEPMKIIMDMGNDPQWRYDGIGDPAILVDRVTNTIWVAATWSHGNRSWRGSGPGMKPEETGQLMLVRSDDDGVTWSKPINITEQIKRPEWCFVLQGPGKGITMRDGTLVFAAQYQDPPSRQRLPHSSIIYSKDRGQTWQASTGAFDDTTESQVVEIEPGVLMLNCRYNRQSNRVVMTTNDLGATWKKHPTSLRSLIEPGACMASLIEVNRQNDPDPGRWLLFSNPDSTQGRKRITIKASPDRGSTWPSRNRLLLDEQPSAGYSCLTMVDDETIGILYEGSQAQMTFQRVALHDVIGQAAIPTPGANAKQSKPQLRLPQIFSDHMVLQSGSEIPIWGFARPGAMVQVRLGKEVRTCSSTIEGKWMVRFSAREANGNPVVLAVQSEDERIMCSDVVFGEVWICAGQSNMEWPLEQTTHGVQALADAKHSGVRLLNLRGVAKGSSGSYGLEQLMRLTPEKFCEGNWETASPTAVKDFSAVAWYFGRCLERELDVPIGLICIASGGTPIEAWMPRESLAQHAKFKDMVTGNWLDNDRLGDFCRTRGELNLRNALHSGLPIPGDELGPNHSFKPGFMWSAAVEPLIPFAIRGVIWYQGESNAEDLLRVQQHRGLFPLMVKQWRERWGRGDFPFLFVQLPAIGRIHWPAFRETQRRTLSQIKHGGMAVTLDTGDRNNVHPALKKPVGERLARWALGATYQSKSHIPYSGPLPRLSKVQEGESNPAPTKNLIAKGDVSGKKSSTNYAILISFLHVGDELKSSDGLPLRHFEICGADGVFHPAEAEVVDPQTIAVSSPNVSVPKHVRYAWQPYPEPPVNLINSSGLPASPFSTQSEEDLFIQRDEVTVVD